MGGGGGNVVPLFRFNNNEKSASLNLNSNNDYKEGISSWVLEKAQQKVNSKIIKEDLFNYVYGFLHSQVYRKKYTNTLTKQPPSIPIVREKLFWQYVTIGKELIDLHLNYESQPKLSEVEISGEEYGFFQVAKMSYKKGSSTIKFNDHITIKNIPSKAYEYELNGNSAIWWIYNQYEATIGNGKKYRNRKSSAHRKEDVSNDPNIFAKEIGNPR
ncbi:MAG: hypothetical protein OXE77_09240, partial [Flavobacteriaceae bacterium]|nr:hypothetical protein [Flavobacteriaceae bacterium]